MTTIVLRVTKGIPLTVNEIDTNYFNLNNDKAEVNNPVFTGAAILVPPGTTAQRPASPSAGHFRYNTEIPGFEGYVAGTWGPIAGTGSGSSQQTPLKLVTNQVFTITTNSQILFNEPIDFDSGSYIDFAANSILVQVN